MFTADEISKLLNHPWKKPCEKRFALMFRLMAFTGLRLGEALGLMPCDISETAINVRRSWDGKRLDTPKNGQERQVSMPDGLFNLLRETSGQRFIFEALRGNQPISRTAVSSALSRMLEECDLPQKTCHCFRHFYNTTLLSSGKLPPETVRAMIGHSSEAMSDRYYHVTEKDREAAISVFRGIADLPNEEPGETEKPNG